MKMSDKVGRAGDGFVGGLRLNHDDKACKPRGFVEINRLRDGNLVERILTPPAPESENLVVTLARRMMSRLISGAAQWDDGGTPTDPTIQIDDSGHPSYPEATITSPSELYITKMRWGTGGANPTPPPPNIDPLATDEDLYAPLSSPAFKTVIVDYPDEVSVRFTATLEQAEANGEEISEVGLFSDAHTLLFARKTFGILTKSVDFSFEFRYTVLF